MITITTPTGNIGRQLVELLASTGKPLTLAAARLELKKLCPSIEG